ncbi:MAG: peptide/nickel transport system permease protein/oligopeptide transport system permease protein, partial [Verrucomicrobiaceae bacterium]|nr:peptide/nickel transport system permease protein/oligopeptide transport system permease protein [Verrucomicrobiaceae bacterium]
MAEAGSTWQGTRPDGWALLTRNRPAMISLWFLAVISLAAIIGPWFLPEGLKETTSSSFLHPLEQDADLRLTHICGTDVNGQDLFYRLLTGAQVSLGIGLLGALLSLFVGTLYGMVSGFAGGKVDEFMMRVVDVIYSVPRILFIMIFIAALDWHFKDWLDGARLWFQPWSWKGPEHAMATLLPYSRVLVMVIALGLME